MSIITLFTNWELLLLISPLVLGIIILGYLLWSDIHYDRQMKDVLEKIAKIQDDMKF